MTDLATLRNRATRPRRTVPLILDGELRDRFDELAAAVAAMPNDRRITTRAKSDEQLAALQAQAAGSTLHVVLEAMSGTLWRAFIAEHPPRQGEDGKILPDDVGGINEESMRRPLVRGCIIGRRVTPDATEVEPLDAEFVDWLLGFVSDGQMDRLVEAAMSVNRRSDPTPLLVPPSATPPSDGA